MMNTYIAISAIMMFIVFGILLGNILHYGLVWTTRNSNVLHHSVKATKNMKRIASKIDVALIGSIVLFSHQWLIMNILSA